MGRRGTPKRTGFSFQRSRCSISDPVTSRLRLAGRRRRSRVWPGSAEGRMGGGGKGRMSEGRERPWRELPSRPPSPDWRSPAARADRPSHSSRDARRTPEPSPIGRRGNGSRGRAVNPEVLRRRGPGDSFEWNRADSSPVRGARAPWSLSRRCRRCRLRCLRVTAGGRR